ncbi:MULTISPECIES: hypothetical protein, partial [Pseudomonas]|uniref:hypothetical protein n=1 Tax=Pseudomonas TaxID=286 RepID=UPI001FF63967
MALSLCLSGLPVVWQWVHNNEATQTADEQNNDKVVMQARPKRGPVSAGSDRDEGGEGRIWLEVPLPDEMFC